MRKLLSVVAILATVYAVALHYHWRWIYPSTYFGKSGLTVRNGHGTCGTVADVHYAANSKGQPTFIDLGHAYPNQNLTIIIWGKNLPNFPTPPAAWEGQHICVTGPIKSYHGKPEIIAYGPNQIQVQN